MDLLDAMARRNPGLPRAAARLHRERLVPPDTYVLDLDAVRSSGAARSGTTLVVEGRLERVRLVDGRAARLTVRRSTRRAGCCGQPPGRS